MNQPLTDDARLPGDSRTKCRFCSDIATSICRVPITEPRIALGAELIESDVAQVTANMQFAMIAGIESAGGDLLVNLMGRRHRGRPIHLRASLPYLVLRTELCETPVCDCHVMDCGDGRSICAYHWQIKEVQAA